MAGEKNEDDKMRMTKCRGKNADGCDRGFSIF